MYIFHFTCVSHSGVKVRYNQQGVNQYAHIVRQHHTAGDNQSKFTSVLRPPVVNNIGVKCIEVHIYRGNVTDLEERIVIGILKRNYHNFMFYVLWIMEKHRKPPRWKKYNE